MEKQNLEILNSLTQKLLSRFAADGDANIVFSPVSVITLLAMIADATGSETREEIAKALGYGDDPQKLFDWLSKVHEEITQSGALVSSNAVCVKADLKDKLVSGYEEHLKEAFEGRLFSGSDMVSAVNEWVNENTKGMIPCIADPSMNRMLACFLNAIAFEAKWERRYENDDIEPGDFTNADGSCNEVTMMHSSEWQYIEDSNFTGFTKPYKDVGYSFMALLPKEEDPECLRKVARSIDLIKLYESRSSQEVMTAIPEFKYEFMDELNDFCKGLGIEKAFSNKADFSPMVDEWVKVEKILHKAFIQVDRKGTKAAAITAAICCAGSAFVPQYKIVELDRPFVFAIVHDETGLPVFVGMVNHLEGGEYTVDEFEIEDVEFDTPEEYEEYATALYQEIWNKIETNKSTLLESAEDIEELQFAAKVYYEGLDIYGLKLLEHNLILLIEESGGK